MKGKVLGVDEAASEGVITGEDGKRYKFAKAEFKAARGAVAGEDVDFEAGDGVATGVFPLKTAAPTSINLGSIGASADGTQNPMVAKAIELVKTRLSVILALVILVASVILAYVVETGSIDHTILGMGDVIDKTTAQTKTAIAQSERMNQMMGGLGGMMGGGSDAAAAMQAMVSKAKGLQTAVTLFYLLYLIPIGAAALLYLEWTNHAMAKTAALAVGAVSVVGVGLIFYAQSQLVGLATAGLGGAIAEGLGAGDTVRQAAKDALKPAMGAWVIALAGAGLIANALGFVKMPAPAVAAA